MLAETLILVELAVDLVNTTLTKGSGSAQSGYSLSMGRARTEQRTEQASGFDAVFGNTRGSAVAQSARDAAEAAARSAAVKRFAWGNPNGRSVKFARAYEDGKQEELEASLLRDLKKEFTAGRGNAPGTVMRSVCDIINLSDPVGAPGLTAPALAVVVAFYQELIEDARAGTNLKRIRLAGAMKMPLLHCLLRKLEVKDFQRLRLLCDIMASALEVVGESASSMQSASATGVMIRILQDAPTQVIEDVLAPWVKVFADRYESAALGGNERKALTRIIRSCDDDIRRRRAFEELCSRARAQ